MNSGLNRDYPALTPTKTRKVKYDDNVSVISTSSRGSAKASRYKNHSHSQSSSYSQNNSCMDGIAHVSSINGSLSQSSHGQYNKIKLRSRKKSSFSWSIWRFFMKAITACIIIIALGICYLSQLEAQDQQKVIEDVVGKISQMKERSKDLLHTAKNLTVDMGGMRFGFGSDILKKTSPSSSNSAKSSNSRALEMGYLLLKNNDPVGAESMCRIATQQDPLEMKGWICLGEARLALHNSAWVMSMSMSDEMGSANNIYMEKLLEARESFQVALDMDEGAMCPEARLGYGLTLFLAATRGEVKLGAPSTSNLIYESILQMKAAASLTSPSMPMSMPVDGAEGILTTANKEEREKIHMAANYNTALAYLALGDSSSATTLLRQVESAVKKQEAGPGDDNDDEIDGINIAEVNLAATLIQRGSGSEAISAGNDAASKICSRDAAYEYASDGDETKTKMLCAIYRNNLAVAKEASGSTNESGEDYEFAVEFERKLLVENGAASVNANLSKPFEDDAESSSEVAVASDESISGQLDETSILSGAIGALEQAAKKDPSKGRLWIALSKAKLRIGDRIGAVEAGTNALNAATTLEEVEAANESLDAALTQPQKVVTSSSSVDQYMNMGEDSHIKSLKLEHEVLRLKLQLMQESLRNTNGFNMNIPQSQHSMDMPIGSVVESSAGEIASEIQDSDQDVLKESPLVQGADIVSSGEAKVDEIADSVNQEEDITIVEALTKSQPQVGEQSVEGSQDADKENEEMEKNAEVEIEDIKEDFSADFAVVDNPNRKEPEAISDITAMALNESEDAVVDVTIENEMEDTVSSTIIDDAQSDIEVTESNNASPADELNGPESEKISGEKDEEAVVTDEAEVAEDEIELPILYNPVPVDVEEIPSSSASYMKIADVYLQKDNFKLATKQFLKVLKKAPYHIPAILGYASSLERHAKPKQLGEVVLAYTNVTKHALMQQNEKLAEASFRRAVSVFRDMEGDRIGILREVSKVAFTNQLAADVQFELGMEILSLVPEDPQNLSDAISCFRIANEFAAKDAVTGNGLHPKSLVQLGKIALETDGDSKKSLSFLEKALTNDLGEFMADALVYSAQSKMNLGDSAGAMQDYQKAIAPGVIESESTAIAHHGLGMLMKKQGMDLSDIENHMEMALNLGMELTPEATNVLGEHHIAVIKSKHRAEWKRYQESIDNFQSRGGIMNGAGVSNNSIFSSKSEDGGAEGVEGSTLSMLEEGAASYDGTIPMGEEIEGDRISVSSQHSRAKANAQ